MKYIVDRESLKAIADAIRAKTGQIGALTLSSMPQAIINIVSNFVTQEKTVTPTTTAQEITADSGFDGLSKVIVNGVPAGSVSVNTPTVNSSGLITASVTVGEGYVSGNTVSRTKQLATQDEKTVTPTKAEQTAVESGIYTTGAVKVAAIPDQYIIPSGIKTITENGEVDVTSFSSVMVNVAGGSGGGSLPSGISAIATGEYTVSTDFATTKQTVTHNLGVVPDMVLFFATENIATTYSMLFALRSTKMGYRSSAYNLFLGYHAGNSTNVSMTNSNGSNYGVSNLTETTFQIASHGSSYYWRSGTYKWIAIKFS